MKYGKFGGRRNKSRMTFTPRAPGVCCLFEDGGGSTKDRQEKKQRIKTIEKRTWKKQELEEVNEEAS